MWVAAERPPRTRAARLFVFSLTCVIISKPVTPCKTFRGNMAEFFNRLLERIGNLEMMEAPVGTVERFVNSQATIVRFLADAFPKENPPSLEDLFTLLDQTIDTEGYFAERSWRQLDAVRDQLKRAILFVL